VVAIRFLHTADWQLGMRRHFLDADAQARYSDARFEAIATLGRLARAHDAAFVVVAGDVFETNHVDRRTVARALDALAAVDVPVWLLPGNHDPLNAASVYRRPDFVALCPPHVRVLGAAAPVAAAPDVLLAGAPWPTKQPARDPVADACAALPAPDGTLRVVVGHGAVDALAPAGGDPARIRLAAVEAALADGRLHYLALGDRHSVTRVGASGRVWYAGTPEPTDFDEVAPGRALLVDLEPDGCAVTELRVGTWTFARAHLDLAGADPVAVVRDWFDALADKRRTVARLGLDGTLTLRAHAELDALLTAARAVCAAVDTWVTRTDVAVLPDDADLDDLGLAGFARDTLAALGADPSRETRDALALLYRLAAA
jgi:DNA repair exonuclease SbcCD nuclease subunit